MTITADTRNIVCGRKLVFGDKEQIDSIKAENSRQAEELARKEEHEEAQKKGKLYTYRVYYTFTDQSSIEVEAVDSKDAEEIAWEKMSEEDADIVRVERIG